MARKTSPKDIVRRVATTELLRLAHKGAASSDVVQQRAAVSIFSLLARTFTAEITPIPQEMMRYYEVLTQ